MKSVASAVADGLNAQLEIDREFILAPVKAGLGFLRDVIPGLRSLTRGYYRSSLGDSLTPTSELSLCLRRSLSRSGAAQQMVRRYC